MFNTFASYLLGGNSNKNENNNECIQTSEIEVSDLSKNSKDNYLTKYKETVCTDDEDWLIIDPTDDVISTRTDSEGDLRCVEIKTVSNYYNKNTNRRRNLKIKKIKCTNSMEESWFVTPPPCFMSTGSINIETSPFENLLIEHPSMSVYHGISNPITCDENIIILDIEEDIPNLKENKQNKSTKATSRRQTIDQFSYQQTKQLILLKNAQKLQEQKHRQLLCRRAIERSNKTRELNSKGGRQKRADMQNAKLSSRVNNNRKC